MDKMFFQPEGAWVGDLIPYYDNGTYYGFYLHDPRILDKQYAEETTWHLVTTEDFKEIRYCGEAIARGGDDKPNKNAYTGSVIKDKDGKYYVFYTAFNADIKINGKSVQSVMYATGDDLYHLTTEEDFLFVSDGEMYEEFDWRDPYVFYHEEEECYWMLLAARRKGAGELRGGCIALCKSKDLKHWTYEKPFYDPKMYITMECPEVFKMGNYWYLVYSTFSDRFVTHYRIADRPEGPWRIPEDDAFDTRANYAIKTASDGERRFAFGWIASKYGDKDFGPWQWGGTMVFHEVLQNPETGELSVKPVKGMKEFYTKEEASGELSFYNSGVQQENGSVEIESETLGAALFDIPEDAFSVEMDITVEDAHDFGIAIHTDDGLEKGYFLKMDRRRNEMVLDMWPRAEHGFYQWQIDGDVAYQVETARVLPAGNHFHIEVYREDSLYVIYVNDEKALSGRMYDHKGGKAGLYVVQGKGKLENYKVKTKA